LSSLWERAVFKGMPARGVCTFVLVHRLSYSHLAATTCAEILAQSLFYYNVLLLHHNIFLCLLATF